MLKRSVVLVKFFLLLTLLFAYGNSYGAAATTSSDTATKTFRNFMQDSFLNHIYQAAQGSFLKTAPDARMGSFFDTNPLLQSPDVQQKINEVLIENIKSAIGSGLATMKKVTPYTNPTLYNRWTTVLRRLGLSDQQIQNAVLFRASGPVNAYDVSAFQDKIVVVVFDQLDNSMDPNQEQSVLGHETGHALARHVLRGVEHVSITLQLGNLYAQNGNFGGFSDLRKLEDYELHRGELQPYQQAFWDKIFSVYKLNMIQGSDAGTVAYDGMQKIKREKFVSALMVLQDAAAKAPELSAKTVAGYLQNMTLALSEMDVPQDTVAYYADLYKNLANAKFNQRDPAQFTEYMLEGIANAGGKDLESTADRYGQIVTDAYTAATTDLNFKGSDLDPVKVGLPNLTHQQLIDRNVQETVDEWIELHQTYEPDYLLELFGRDPAQNHPLVVKRIIDMLEASRSVGTLGLSNPFLKNVILYDELIKQGLFLEQQLVEITADLNSPELKISAAEKREAAVEVAQIQSVIQKTQDGATTVANAVMKLIMDPSLKANSATNGTGQYKNPRLSDFLDFELAIRQTELSQFEADLKNAQDPQEQKDIVDFMNKISRLHDNPLVSAVSKYASQSNVQNNIGHGADWTKFAAVLKNPKATSADVQNARGVLAQDAGVGNRKTRVPVDLRVPLTPSPAMQAKLAQAAQQSQPKKAAKVVAKTPTAAKTDSSKKSVDDDLASRLNQCGLLLGLGN